MTNRDRTLLTKVLVELTRLRRLTGWPLAVESEGLLAPLVIWCDEAQAYGAQWTCGQKSAMDIARLLR